MCVTDLRLGRLPPVPGTRDVAANCDEQAVASTGGEHDSADVAQARGC